MSQSSTSSTTGAGFSVVEVLIAAAVLLIMTVGLLPMFVRAINNNVQGERLTQLVHSSNSGFERVAQTSYLDPSLAVAAGDSFGTPPTVGSERVELYSREEDRWYLEADFPDEQTPAYRRAVRVRNLIILPADLDEQEVEFEATDAPGDLKEIEIVVTDTDSTVFGPSRQLTMRYMKAF